MVLNVIKYILGFILAIAVLLGSGLTVALYFVNRTAIPPARPTFANDPKPKSDKPKATQAKATTKSESKTTSTPTPTESPKSLPPGAYQAVVTWPQGLSIRDQPTLDSQSIGGVAANKNVIILEDSKDKNWQKIRVEENDQEGWVKAGNTKKVE